MIRYNSLLPFYAWFLFFSIFVLISCDKTPAETDQIIATVDGDNISLTDFKLFYELDPNFGIDSSGLPALRDELYYFIHQKLALRKAGQEGLTSDPVFLMAVEWEKKQAMLRELYRIKVQNSIEISEEELRQKYKNDNVRVHVKQLFSRSENEIKSIQSQLKNGRKFEEIAPAIFKDSVLAANGGDLGWIEVGELEDDFAAAVLRLKKDEISDIVKTKFGFHIIKLLNKKSQKMLSDNEYFVRRPTLEKQIRQLKSMDASRKFISDFMKETNPQLDPVLFLAFWNVLVPKQDREKWELPGKLFLTNISIANCRELLTPMLTKNLIVSKHGGIQLETYLSEMEITPVSNRPGFKSKRELSHQIATWVRDKMLYTQAQKLDLGKSGNVLNELTRYKEEQSYHYYLRQYVEETEIPEYVEEFYLTKDQNILKEHSLLRHFNTTQEWQWHIAALKLREELKRIPAVIEINEELLSRAANNIDWDRRIRMFMIRKPQ